MTTIMDLQEFVKTKKTQKFLKPAHSNTAYTKSDIVSEIEHMIEKSILLEEDEYHIKKSVERILHDYEPYTEKVQKETKGLLKKWGLVK